MSFFDQVETTVANTRFLQAVNEKHAVRLNLKPHDQLTELEAELRKTVTLDKVFKQPLGFFLLQKFLIHDGGMDKALFVKAADHYAVSDDSRRRTVSRTLYGQLLKLTEHKQSAPSDAAHSSPPGHLHHDPSLPLLKTDDKSDAPHHDHHAASSNDHPTPAAAAAATSATPHSGGPVMIHANLMTALKETVQMETPPASAFEKVADIVRQELLAAFPRFLESDLFKQYVQLIDYSHRPIKLDDFRVFRVLGRGAFGAVSAVQKTDTGAIFAMKEMRKRMVKANKSEWLCNSEKRILSKMRSPFVLSLRYAFHDEESLYLILDMCSGGDLKFHLNTARSRRFPEAQARFYAAEILLGLEHIHAQQYVYRDFKPDNLLLDEKGHVKISDLGLTIKLRDDKLLRHVAGTSGYWAPEVMSRTGTYYTSDIWSWAVCLYEMLSGQRPKCTCRKGTGDWCPFGSSKPMEESAKQALRAIEVAVCAKHGKPPPPEKPKDASAEKKQPDDPAAPKPDIWKPPAEEVAAQAFDTKWGDTLHVEITYPEEFFSASVKDLLQQIFVVDPRKRLGSGHHGMRDLKRHGFFSSIDWHRLQALEIPPPFVPEDNTVHANSIADVGDFDESKFKKVKLTPEDVKQFETWDYVYQKAAQKELVTALEKMESRAVRESMSALQPPHKGGAPPGSGDQAGPNETCCHIL